MLFNKKTSLSYLKWGLISFNYVYPLHLYILFDKNQKNQYSLYTKETVSADFYLQPP